MPDLLPDPSPSSRPAVLLGEFPSLSETFILRELDALDAIGWVPVIYALRRGRPPVIHERARDRLPAVRFLPPPSASPGALIAAWRDLRQSDPRRAGRWLQYLFAAGVCHPGMVYRVLRHLPAVRELGRAVAAGEIGYLHAHFATLPTEVAWAAAGYGGCPFGFSTHARDLFTQPVSLLRRKIEAASLVTACTATHYRFLEQCVPAAPPGRLLLAYHGIPIPSEEPALEAQPGRIVAVGRLVPKKAFDTLIRAVARLAAGSALFHCEIWGDGPERDRLSALIRKLNLQDRVHLPGAFSMEQLPRIIRQAEVVAVPSRILSDGDRDGIPNVLLEAMVRARPVVAADTPSIREVVTDGVDGCLAPPDQPAAWAACLGDLLADAGRRAVLGEQAALTIRTRFDAAVHGRDLANRLREIQDGIG